MVRLILFDFPWASETETTRRATASVFSGSATISPRFVGTANSSRSSRWPSTCRSKVALIFYVYNFFILSVQVKPSSPPAWGEALGLARETQAELYAISVARGEGEIVQAEEIMQRLINAANQQGMPLQGLVPQGLPPEDAIVQEALRHKADIIIMGSHGRTGVKRLLMAL
jgi:Universal stress protein family